MFNALRHTLIVLITTLSFTGQVLSFDQPVSVADVKTHPGYYEGNWVTIEGVVHDVRWETRMISDSESGIDFPVTWYIFELTDGSGTMTVESLKIPPTGEVIVRAIIASGTVIVNNARRVQPPCVTASY